LGKSVEQDRLFFAGIFVFFTKLIGKEKPFLLEYYVVWKDSLQKFKYLDWKGVKQ